MNIDKIQMKIFEKDDKIYVFSNLMKAMAIEKVACADYDDSKKICTLTTTEYVVYEVPYDTLDSKYIVAYTEDGVCYIIVTTLEDAITYNEDIKSYMLDIINRNLKLLKEE